MIGAIDSLNALSEPLLPFLWRLSLELIVLAAAVVVALKVFRVHSPRVRHAFWLLVLLKPAATILIASPISLYVFLHPLEASPPLPVRPAMEAMQVAPHTAVEDSETFIPRTHYAGYTGGSESPTAPLRIEGVLAGLWILFAGLFAARLLSGWLLLRRLARQTSPASDDELIELMREASSRIGVRNAPQLRLHDGPHGPVLAGLWRPTAILPRKLVEALPCDRLLLALAHEIMHARRRDNWTLPLQRFVEAALFFHPVVWLAGRALRREAESACDDAVLDAFGDPEAYADSLTRVAEWRGP